MEIINRVNKILTAVGLNNIVLYILFLGSLSAFSELLFLALVSNLFSALTNTTAEISNVSLEEVDYVLVSFTLFAVLLIKLFVSYAITGTNQKISANTSSEIIRNQLRSEYSEVIQSKQSDVIAEAVSYVDRFTTEFIAPLFRMVVSILTLLVILLFAVYEQPYIAGPMIILFTLVYVVIFSSQKRVLGKSGEIVSREYARRVSFLTQANSNYKYIKATRNEKWFITEFSQISTRLAYNVSKQIFLSEIPRIIIEVLFACSVFIIIYYVQKSGDPSSSTILFGVSFIALIAFRSLPQAQQIFTAKSQMKFSDTILAKLETRILSNSPLANDEGIATDQVYWDKDKYRIVGTDVCLKFNSNIIFDNLNFKLQTGDLVLIRGPSGSGKSTLLDLFLKLRTPTDGTIEIFSHTGDALYNFSDLFCYVPQKVFLLGDTITNNVAFNETLDNSRVVESLKLANVYDEFLQMPNGLDTIIGDGGVLISGGQEQRLAIARALYSQRPILIMDEPTAALDRLNETLFFQKLNIFGKNKIIIIASHADLKAENFTQVLDLG